MLSMPGGARRGAAGACVLPRLPPGPRAQARGLQGSNRRGARQNLGGIVSAKEPSERALFGLSAQELFCPFVQLRIQGGPVRLTGVGIQAVEERVGPGMCR